MSAEDRIAHIKELNKARAKKYYEANKDKIAERRKAQRAQCREALGKAPRVVAKKAPEAVAEPVAEPIAPRIRVKRPVSAKKAPEPEPLPVEAPAPAPARLKVKRPMTAKRAEALKAQAKKSLTYDQAVAIISTTDTILADGTRETYKGHLKAVQFILNCEDLYTCFMDAPRTIKLIDGAKTTRKPIRDYALNSKKAFVQMILRLSDVLSIPLTPETKQEYTDAFDGLKLDSKAQTEGRIEEGKKEEVMTFEKYLPTVAETFGKGSTEYLIASLYSVHGFRDNLQLRIVKVPDSKGDNQLIVPAKQGEPYKILLTKYKTGNKYGPKTITLPDDISKLVKAYTTKNKKQLGGNLFGTEKLSRFISKFNKEMGLPITINKYREMLVAPVIDGMSSTERVQLAKKMGHAPATSAQYKQKKKILVPTS